MKNFEITYTTDNKIFSAVRVVAETAEQAQAYYTAQTDECSRSVNVVGCQETTAAVKPSQSVLTVPEGWEPQRTAEKIIADIITIFNDDEELFNNCIEELDQYNGYLGDDRYYNMEELGEFYRDSDPLELLQRVYFGYAEDEIIIDQYGEEHRREFNPMHDYFRYNGYGNLVSTNYKDYSDHLDHYTINSLLENRSEVDSIDDNKELATLFDELEEVGDNEQ